MTVSGISAERPSLGRLALGYLELTKPRIVALVIFTGLPGLLLATHGLPSPRLLIATLVGTALAAGSAACFNHYLDRDIDGLMKRTAARPLPSGLLPPSHAIVLGIVLALAAIALLLAYTTPLATLLAVISIVYYAWFYTAWLKRRTPQNIVIGGGAGASAPLIAWAAATGTLAAPPVILAGIIFLWTPPHFWALALYRSEDYLRAGIPMLPVTHGEEETRRQIVFYSWLLAASTLSLALFGVVGPLYLVSAALLGARFVWMARRLKRTRAVADAVALFRYSIVYLFLLFALLTADAILRAV